MKITIENLHRLCEETDMEYEQALALLRQFDGDYRRALRAWQDERSIFVEPLRVESCARPLSDRLRQAWKHVRSALQCFPIMKLLTVAAALILCRRIGGWMLMLPLLAGLFSLLGSLVSEFRRSASRRAHSAS